MKFITKMTWGAVAVLGLYSPTFSHAGNQSGGSGSHGGMSHGAHFGGSNSSGGNGGSMKSGPSSGSMNGQVFKFPVSNQTGGKFGTKPGPIVQLPTNNLPPISQNPGGKLPGNGGINPFPGGKPPIIDPGKTNGGGKFPGNGGINPFPGGQPPFPGGNPGNGNPGNTPPGGGNNPPGGGNNPPGGGNGNGNGNGQGHHHHWPYYPFAWGWPGYYPQPYCGTVYVNGGWTYATQPVAPSLISLVQVGNTLPEIPSNATFRMQATGLGPAKGLAAVEVNGVGMQAELLEWNADSVVVRLPAVGLTQPAISQLHILQSDGSVAKTLDFKMLPAIDTAVASAN